MYYICYLIHPALVWKKTNNDCFFTLSYVSKSLSIFLIFCSYFVLFPGRCLYYGLSLSNRNKNANNLCQWPKWRSGHKWGMFYLVFICFFSLFVFQFSFISSTASIVPRIKYVGKLSPIKWLFFSLMLTLEMQLELQS